MKRLVDIIGASIGLILLSPLLLLITILVVTKLGYPPFFVQIRPGLHGKPFKLIKFRTMTNERDADGVLLPDDKRITRFGAFLRSSSLDEFPELINVLTGKMSLVGPRPLLMEYLDRYTPDQARRHLMRPGITGFAQIKGRNAISWDDKFKLDSWYIDNQSLFVDIKILVGTVWQVLARKGVSAEGHATMPKFMGDTVKD